MASLERGETRGLVAGKSAADGLARSFPERSLEPRHRCIKVPLRKGSEEARERRSFRSCPCGPLATPLLGWGRRSLGAAGGPITGGDLQEWPGVWASLGGQAKLSVGVRGHQEHSGSFRL